MSDTVLIVGFGSIGRRHAQIVSQVLPEAKIVVLRRPESQGEVEGFPVVYCLEEALLTNPRFAILAGPSPFRLALAKQLIEANIPLFLEKPLSNNMKGVEAFATLCEERKAMVQVGYCLRFEPSLIAFKMALEEKKCGDISHIRADVGQYLPDWRPDTDYRESVSARKDMGGGALLELSHEIDYVRWLCGEVATVSGKLKNISNLDLDVEDCAQIELTFKNGVVGSIHLDMVQKIAVRTCKVTGRAGVLEWDGLKKAVTLYPLETQKGETLYQGSSTTGLEMFVAQFKHFLSCLETRTPPLIGVRDGQRALEIVEATRCSSQEGRQVNL